MPDDVVSRVVPRPVAPTPAPAVWTTRRPSPESRTPEAITRLGAVLQAHPEALVLTGAGMSTESGIPDYRGRDGTRRVTPMQHAEFVASHENRRRYWARSFTGWQRFSAAAPNRGHRAVAELQRYGAIGAVITQNVDGLHQLAGTEQVTELHGSLDVVVCLTCGHRSARDAVQQRLTDANPDFAAQVRAAATDGSRV
ncbi:MAG: Sir2 family NAD-dependent protein deacetylase, partial [Phycicoccus sp.]